MIQKNDSIIWFWNDYKDMFIYLYVWISTCMLLWIKPHFVRMEEAGLDNGASHPTVLHLATMAIQTARFWKKKHVLKNARIWIHTHVCAHVSSCIIISVHQIMFLVYTEYQYARTYPYHGKIIPTSHSIVGVKKHTIGQSAQQQNPTNSYTV